MDISLTNCGTLLTFLSGTKCRGHSDCYTTRKYENIHYLIIKASRFWLLILVVLPMLFKTPYSIFSLRHQMVPRRGWQFFQSKDFFLNSDKLWITTHLRTKHKKTGTHCKWICKKEQRFSCYKLYSFFIIKVVKIRERYTFLQDKKIFQLPILWNTCVFSENCTGFTESFRINYFCCGIAVFKRQAKSGILCFWLNFLILAIDTDVGIEE